MSHRLIARSNDLLALRDAGFHLEIRNGYLLIKDVPYVTGSREVRENGVLVSKLETEIVGGHERTKKPTAHVAYWMGKHPCHANGEKIRSFENPSSPQDFGNGVKIDFTFSAKADYRDYQQKMQAYLGWIVGEAKKIRPDVRAETGPVYATDDDDDDVFHYIDTASSRVHIGADNEKLEGQHIAIVGVGGTGSYSMSAKPFHEKAGLCQELLWLGKFISDVFLCPDIRRFLAGEAAVRAERSEFIWSLDGRRSQP